MINPDLLSRAALHALHAAGWTPKRCIDIRGFIAMLKPYGWQISRPAQDILESLGDLDFTTRDYNAPTVDDLLPVLPMYVSHSNLSFELAYFETYDDEWLYRTVHEHPYIKAMQLDTVYPIGILHYSNLIFVAQNGAVFAIDYSKSIPGYRNAVQVIPYGPSIYAAFDEFLRIGSVMEP